jgi:uncharacterized lipoprotein YajG
MNDLHAETHEGNMRYSISAETDIHIITKAQSSGKQMKKYRPTHNVQIILSAANTMLGDVIRNMASNISIRGSIKSSAQSISVVNMSTADQLVQEEHSL